MTTLKKKLISEETEREGLQHFHDMAKALEEAD